MKWLVWIANVIEKAASVTKIYIHFFEIFIFHNISYLSKILHEKRFLQVQPSRGPLANRLKKSS